MTRDTIELPIPPTLWKHMEENGLLALGKPKLRFLAWFICAYKREFGDPWGSLEEEITELRNENRKKKSKSMIKDEEKVILL